MRNLTAFVVSAACLVGALAPLPATSPLAKALSKLDSVQAGWEPLVAWWGGGDPTQAVHNLMQLTSAFHTVLHRTEIDEHTRSFMDGALEQLSDFDLDDFHALLPEEHAGARELRVRGDLKGGHYVVRRAHPSQPFQVSLRGPRRGLADFSQIIRSRRMKHAGEADSYLVGLQFGLGVGRFSWDQSVDAIADFGRIVSNDDPRVGAPDKPVASAASRQLVRSLHPDLAADDVEPTALLFDAYPNLSRAFSQVGQLDDLRAEQLGEGARHITLKVHASPERLAKRQHQEFARHIERMGKIAHIDVRWIDAKNRTLIKWSIDSDTLRFGMECYVKDGLLLPWQGKTVFADQGIDPMSAELERSRAMIHARVQMFGVTVTLTNLRVNLRYQPHTTYAEIAANVTSVPTVNVEGAAAGLIDVFIPGNIQSLTLDFFRRAALGNDKKGIAVQVALGSEQRDTDGVIEAAAELDALDSGLVKMGVGMVNDRLMPSSEVIADGKKILGELHDAFISDLSRYRGRLGS